MIRKDKQLYDQVTAGPWTGVVPVEVREREPLHRWQGGKMPLDLVKQITSFFEWSEKETGGESVVHLYYNEDTEEWKATVLPQKGYTGMSVSLLPDHPGRLEAIEALGRGFELCSTWHHHSKANAFQSHTDAADERDVFGLHVTVGNIGSQVYSLDARCSFRKFFTPAVLSDWIESPLPDWLEDLPVKLADGILEHYVCSPEPDWPFPEEWKANVIKVEQPKVVWGPYVKQEHWSQQGYRPPWQAAPPVIEAPRVTLEQQLDEFCHLYGLDAAQLAEHVADYAQDEILRGLLEVAADVGVPLGEVLRKCNDLADDTYFKLLEDSADLDQKGF